MLVSTGAPFLLGLSYVASLYVKIELVVLFFGMENFTGLEIKS